MLESSNFKYPKYSKFERKTSSNLNSVPGPGSPMFPAESDKQYYNPDKLNSIKRAIREDFDNYNKNYNIVLVVIKKPDNPEYTIEQPYQENWSVNDLIEEILSKV